MKNLSTIILISTIGLQSLYANNENLKSLAVISRVLLTIEDDLDLKKSNQTIQPKNSTIKIAERNIDALKKIRRILERLQNSSPENSQDDLNLKKYTEKKESLIQDAKKDIGSLIEIERSIIKIERRADTKKEHEVSIHRKHKAQLINKVKIKIDKLLKTETKLIELAKKYNQTKDYQEAETVYYETEFLKGPEIHDREVMDIHHAQYHDHLHKGINDYNPDHSTKLRNYLYGNT